MGKKNLYQLSVTTLNTEVSDGSSTASTSFSEPGNRNVALQNYYSTSPVRDIIYEGVQNTGVTFPSLKELNQSVSRRRSVFERTWSARFALLLTCLSASVGLGNVWRFPKVALEYGTGSFLIVYVVVVVLVAQPLHFLELSLGQFRSQGPLKLWKCFPALKGLGYSQLVITFYLCLNLSVVMSWSFFYFTQAFRTRLPWAQDESASNSSSIIYTSENDTSKNKVNGFENSQFHWRNKVLHDENPDDETSSIRGLNWTIALCLAAVWVCIFFCLLPGIEFLRKMTYLTCVMPFICLAFLLVYLMVGKGALQYRSGLLEMLTPRWEELKNVTVWYAACQQSFISLNLAFGQLVLFSSFNEFEHHVIRDSIIICGFDTLASFLASFVVFAIVGSSCNISQLPDFVNDNGFGIPFVTYSFSIGGIGWVPQLWTSLFFFMLFLLGLGNVVSLMTSLLYIFQDRPQAWRRIKIISFFMCLLCLGCGLVFTTDVSLDLLTHLDRYGIGFCVVLFAILETMGIAWGYSLKNLSNDMEFMFKSSISFYWRTIWGFIIPVGLTVVLVYCHVIISPAWEPCQSQWTFIFGWMSAGVAVLCIPIGAIVAFRSVDQYGFRDKLRGIFRAEVHWGPTDPMHLRNWLKRNSDNCRDVAKSPSGKKRKRDNKVVFLTYQNGGFREDDVT